MKIMMKRLLIVVCALSLFMSMPGVTVLAENLQDDIVETAAEEPEEIIDTPCIIEASEKLVEESEPTDEISLADIPSYTELSEEMMAKIEDDISSVEELVGTQYTDSDPGFEVYNANTRIYGLEGSGNSVYDIMMNTDMIYQQLAEYALEEKALYYTSGMWIGFFDEVFKNCPMYGYETILMDYLAFDAESAETKNSLDDAILDFSVNLTKAGMKLTEVNVDTYNKFINDLSKEQAIQLGKGVIDKTILRLAEDSFDLALLSGNTAKDVINNLAEITAASKKRQKQVAFLNMVKENLGEDDYWLRFAFEDIVGTYGNANLPVMMMQGGRKTAYECGRALVGMGWDALTDAAGENVAVPIVLVKTGASGLNVLFGTKTLSNDLMAILTVYILDSELREALRKSKWEFLNNPTTENAIRFNGAFDSYLEYQMYASQVAKQYLNDIINSGLLTKTYAQICHTENIETADELIKLCDSQMNIRRKIASFEHQYYQIYYGKYDKNMFAVAINGQNEPQEIPVTGISFSRKTRTIQMDNTWVEIDDVVIKPSNATNQGFKITSSDESILTVNSLFRWMTPMKAGIVTLTVTSNDGGFKATQRVTVRNDKIEEGVVTRETYNVGDKVRATIVINGDKTDLYFYSNNGTLYKDWKEIIGESAISNIRNIDFLPGSGTMFLPEDSTHIFGREMKVTGNDDEMIIGRPTLEKLESINLEKISTSKVKNMSYMFAGCVNLKDLDLSSFDTSDVSDMSGMFCYCSSLEKLDLSNLNTSNVTDMTAMFFRCEKIKELELKGFNTVKVLDMKNMFMYCSALEKLDISNFNTSKVTNMKDMFRLCSSLKQLNLVNFKTANVINMSNMFGQCKNLKTLELGSFNTSKVEDMKFMFLECSSLAQLDVSNFNTTRVKDMHDMFCDCSSIKELDVSSFNTSNVINMSEMFAGCTELVKLELMSFNTSKVTKMGYMFGECNNLKSLDLSNFDTSSVKDLQLLFGYLNSLQVLKTPMKNDYKNSRLPNEMYDSKGNKYLYLPSTSKSIILAKTTKMAKEIESSTQNISGFSDVQDPNHAFYKAIYWAADAGITKGYPDGTFGIDRSCTRGEMIMFLWRYAGKPAAKALSKSPFKDVPKTHAFYNAIIWASQKGITKGYPDGTFGINRNVSRGECMMFLWRLRGKPAPKAVSVSPFKDVPKTHAFYNAILWGAQKKITNGYTSGPKKGTFGINENCTRGAIVTFLYRAR